jgi:hypothetical protein
MASLGLGFGLVVAAAARPGMSDELADHRDFFQRAATVRATKDGRTLLLLRIAT